MPERDDLARENIDDWVDRQKRWAVAFEDACRAAGLSLSGPADVVGIDRGTLGNWRSGRTRLDPAFLQPLADSVNASAFEWATILGWADEEHFRSGRTLERTKQQLRASSQRLADIELAGGTTASVVQAALSTGSWAVDAEPWVEGPPSCRLRIGDLITIRHSSGRAIRAREIRNDTVLGPALTIAGAVRQPGAIWNATHKGGANPETDLRSEWIWGVPRLNAPRPRATIPCQLAMRSIAILSTHISAWVTDVASLVALALGYRGESTTALSRIQLGEQLRDDPDRNTDADTSRARAAIAADLLADPFGIGNHLVWAHAMAGTSQPIIDGLRESRSAPLVVYLRPSDTLHTYLVHRVRGNNDLGVLESRRHELDLAVEGTGLPAVILQAGYPSDLDPAGLLSTEIRDAFLERSIVLALQVLKHLAAIYGGPALDHLHPNTPAQFRETAARLHLDIQHGADVEALTDNRSFV